MILSDRDLKKRLITLEDAGLKPDVLDRVKKKDIPRKLDQVLTKGKIIIDPPPSPNAIDADTIDLKFGNIVEVADTVLEVVSINGKIVIRRFTRDYRFPSVPLQDNRKVSTIDGSRIKFFISDDETLELQPGMLILAHTLELVCIPYDLQMEMGGRSRIAREGITSHVSSPIFHAGWVGHAVMEITNISRFNFNVYPGLVFSSVSFRKLTSAAETPYLKKQDAQYSGQR